MWSTILNGNVWKGELQSVDKNHETFWVDVTITPNLNSNDEVIGFTAIRKNITERKIIEALSITDELTTLYNKRFFNKTFPKEIKRAKRLKTNFVFIILDIDNFKLYNDTYGHKEGDNVLQEVGVLIRKMFKRSYDFAFRIGGEEFAIIFSERDIKKIEPYIEYLRKSIEDLNIMHEKNADHGVVTASIGYRIVDKDTMLSEEEIYTQADEALYIAKSRGRNRFINYDDIVQR
jgi:diguanylate cyclase (GGDEF)-like protein